MQDELLEKMEKANLPESISKEFCAKIELLEVSLLDILYHFTAIQGAHYVVHVFSWFRT